MGRYRFLLRERLAQSREWISGRSPWRFELVLLACLLVGLTALICSRYLPSLSGLEEGSYSPRTVIAEKAVTVLDIEATDELKARVAELVAPMYIPDAGALATATGKLQTFLEIAGRLRANLAGESDRTAALAVLRNAAPETVSDATLDYLLAVPSTSADRIQSQTLGALETLYAGPITEDSLERVRSTLRSIADNVGGSEAAADAVYEIAAGYLGPNQVIDEERTEARRDAAMDQVAPVMVSVSEGRRWFARARR